MEDKQVLALLSGMAPAIPAAWAVQEFKEKFVKDHPSPSNEYFSFCHIVSDLLRGRIPRCQPYMEWLNKRNDAQESWEQEEWPLIWARKRMDGINQ